MFPEQATVLLIDSSCTLCNKSARWLIRRDKKARLRFAALGSEAANRILSSRGLPAPPPGTAVLIKSHNLFIRSDAILLALQELPPPWPLLGRLARAIPRPLRDAAYQIIASLRIVFFGRSTACQVFSEQEKARFISAE